MQNCEYCKTIFKPDRKSRKARFCSRLCSAISNGIDRRGRVVITMKGYRTIYDPKTKKMVMEHRHVMEKHIGRLLRKSEVVHHLNGIRTDNRPENLEVLKKKTHDRLPKPKAKPIKCPYCRNMIKVSGRVRHVDRL